MAVAEASGAAARKAAAAAVAGGALARRGVEAGGEQRERHDAAGEQGAQLLSLWSSDEEDGPAGRRHATRQQPRPQRGPRQPQQRAQARPAQPLQAPPQAPLQAPLQAPRARSKQRAQRRAAAVAATSPSDSDGSGPANPGPAPLSRRGSGGAGGAEKEKEQSEQMEQPALEKLKQSLKSSVDRASLGASTPPTPSTPGAEGGHLDSFRRQLWRYLFESLHRSVDELYCLCEVDGSPEKLRRATAFLVEAADDFKALERRHQQQERASETGASVAWEVRPRRSTELAMPSALAALPRDKVTSADFNPAEILASLAAPKETPLFGRHVFAGAGNSFSDACATAIAQPVGEAQGKRPPSARKTNRKLDLGQLAVGAKELSTPPQSDAEEDRVTVVIAAEQLAKEAAKRVAEAMAKAEPDARAEAQEGDSGDAADQAKAADGAATGAAAWRVKKNWGASFAAGKRRSGGGSGSSGQSSGRSSNCASSTGTSSGEHSQNPSPLCQRAPSPLKVPVPAGAPPAATVAEAQDAEPTSPRVSFDRPAMEMPSSTATPSARAKSLHDKLMSPERKKKSPCEAAAAAAAKQARASVARERLEMERLARLATKIQRMRQAEEWQEVRRSRLKAKLDKRESSAAKRHEARLAEIASKAGEMSRTSKEKASMTRAMEEEARKEALRQKLKEAEARRVAEEEARRLKEEEARQRIEAAAMKRQALEEARKAKIAAKKAKKDEAAAKAAEERRAMLQLAAEVREIKERRVAAAQAARPADEMARLDRKLASRMSESAQRRRSYLAQIHQHAEAKDPSCNPPTTPNGRHLMAGAGVMASSDPAMAAEDADAKDAAAKRVREERKKKAKRIRQRMAKIAYEWAEPPAADAAVGSIGGAKVRIQKAAAEMQRLAGAVAKSSSASGSNFTAVANVARELVRCLPAAVSAQRAGAAGASKLPPARLQALQAAAEGELHLARRCGALEATFAALAAVAQAAGGARARHLDDDVDGSAAACNAAAEAAVLCLGLADNAAYVRAKNIYLPIVPLLASELDATCEGGAVGVECRPRGPAAVRARAQLSASARSSSSASAPVAAAKDDQARAAQPTLLEALLAMSDSVLTRAPPASRLRSGSAAGSGVSHKAPSDAASEPEGELHGALVAYVVSQGIVHRLRELFAVWDRPQAESSPIPSAIEWGLKLLGTLCGADERHLAGGDAAAWMSEVADGTGAALSAAHAAPVLQAMSATNLVDLPSLLTATLLHSAPGLGAAAADADRLPPNFVPVATAVMRILNTAARLDHAMVQELLGSADMRIELFHLLSFLLSFCTAAWASRPATPSGRQGGVVAELLEQVMVLIGCFARDSPNNQAVLTWGRAPTILTKLCHVPFPFFSDPALKPLLLVTLHAATEGNAKASQVLKMELGESWLAAGK